ncbi:MAG: VWA domain-containing protein [Pyrinomonadaceae bacterium]|nr:VWA domain-containing protein [Acidobacteriota bacterium]
MGYVAIFLLFICFAGLTNGSAQPLAVPAQTPPTIKSVEPSSKVGGRPPVLTGDSKLKPQTPAASKPAQAEDEIIRVDTELVTTPVSVLDRNGRFIPGLRKRDFKIFENGIPQKIEYFQSEEQPFTVVLMIDTSPSTKYRIDEIHFAAVTFINQLRPNDKVMVVAFDQRFRVLAEPTNERTKLYAAIYKAQFGSGTSIYDAVDHIAHLNLLNAPGRKAVVLFTDGVDTTSRRSDFAGTLATVEETDALFYPIRYNTQRRGAVGPNIASLPGFELPQSVIVRLGHGQSEAEYEKGRLYLEGVAANSGGRMFEADTITNLDASFAGVAEELRRQYSIGYYSADATAEPGERRKIKIQVARPRVVVRAKNSYIVK